MTASSGMGDASPGPKSAAELTERDAPLEQDPPPEVDALRAEVAELRRRNEELATKRSPGSRARAVARAVIATVLVVVGVMCLTASVPAIWGRNLVLDTNKYVDTLTPLARDPGLQSAVVQAVNDQFRASVDIGELVRQALPGRGGDLLSGPVSNAADALVRTAATKFVDSSAFVTLWSDINRAAHTALVAILTGQREGSAALSVRQGVLTLNLAPVIARVKQRLVAAGLTVAAQVPTVGATIQIAQVKGLTRAQSLVRLLNRLAHWLPLLGLLCFAAAVAAAHKRRRMIIWAALGSALGMVTIAIGLAVGRQIYLHDLPLRYLTADDAGRLFDTLVRYLRDGLRLVCAFALLVALGVWLTGPAPSAQAVRRGIGTATRAGAARMPRSRALRVGAEHRRGIAAGVVGVAAVVVTFWSNPSALTVLVIGLVTLAIVLVVLSLRPPLGPGSPSGDPT